MTSSAYDGLCGNSSLSVLFFLPSHIVAISKLQHSALVTLIVGTGKVWRFMPRSKEGSSAADAVSGTLYKPSGYMLGSTWEMNGVSHGALKSKLILVACMCKAKGTGWPLREGLHCHSPYHELTLSKRNGEDRQGG